MFKLIPKKLLIRSSRKRDLFRSKNVNKNHIWNIHCQSYKFNKYKIEGFWFGFDFSVLILSLFFQENMMEGENGKKPTGHLGRDSVMPLIFRYSQKSHLKVTII